MPMIAAVNGTTLSYHEVGQGSVCLVLHGGMGTDHTMYRVLDPLGERLRLVYFDQRGTGRSGRPPLNTLTMPQLADDAAELARQLGAEQVLVFGHSFGGFVAQELAVRHPDLVSGLVLAGTTAGQRGDADRIDEDSGPPPSPALAAMIGKMVTEADTDEKFAAMFREILPYYVHRFDPSGFSRLTAGAVADVATFHATVSLMRTWSVIDRLDQVKAPTLLLTGEHDPVCSPAQSRRIARRMKSADVVVFDNSGHFPWLDEPEQFYAVMHHWLDQHRGQTHDGCKKG
ncbi:alpha/beta hydrolase [Kribbella albertanoniae]|uniref:Alpha/beta hydrolase n=1 Tax=Kribbella albertanoniae TaxID=1266829 RepID=A0A4V2XSR3_9ACTN|nr:alpha/beta hydrolase [Kribbella albertanoniae]TDC34675.1 alpha/beta hydrolase [Kribbella albertanoniae]